MRKKTSEGTRKSVTCALHVRLSRHQVLFHKENSVKSGYLQVQLLRSSACAYSPPNTIMILDSECILYRVYESSRSVKVPASFVFLTIHA